MTDRLICFKITSYFYQSISSICQDHLLKILLDTRHAHEAHDSSTLSILYQINLHLLSLVCLYEQHQKPQ